MPVLPGDMGIKSYSYEIVVLSDGTNSWECCENCVALLGGDPTQSKTTIKTEEAQETQVEVSPIFADTEMDREPFCDSCGYTSYIFSPTADCIDNWVALFESYLTEAPRTKHNLEYLDSVADRMKTMNLDLEDETCLYLFRKLRANEIRLVT